MPIATKERGIKLIRGGFRHIEEGTKPVPAELPIKEKLQMGRLRKLRVSLGVHMMRRGGMQLRRVREREQSR